MKVRSSRPSSAIACGIAVLCATVLLFSAPSPAQAAGVVGTGIAASCTDTALNTALAGGGLVTFNCGPAPVTIDISTGTGTKTIAADTTIDGGGLITISGGNAMEVFSASGVKFGVRNLTIANGMAVNGGGGIGAIGGGTLTVTNSTFTANTGVAVSRASDGGSIAGGGIFNVGGATLTVTDSTFTGNSGGAISSASTTPPFGTLTVTNSTFTDNSADLGSALSIFYFRGTCTVTNSTFTGNSGGSIANGDGTLIVTDSTFTDNTTDDGGAGISNLGGTLSVTNSTFVGNSATSPSGCNGCGYGGGISNGGTLTVTNSTFTGNRADGVFGGGSIYTADAPALLRDSIVANSPSGSNCVGVTGATDGGHNLDSGTSCGFSAANGSLSNTDPQLDPAGLTDNGGPTQTVALCTGVGVPAGCTAVSPAIDAGDQAVCAATPVNDRDQRGFVRPGSGHTQCSIGAYEADSTAQEACAGDCGGAGTVAIDDLITLVNIALGTAAPSACAHGVPSGTDVDVTMIIQAVNNALNGCSDPLASAAEAVVAAAMRKYQVPGVAMALVGGGQVVWSRGYGMADKEAHIPVDASTVFQVGSLSKAVAAWGALKVAESGALDLGMPIGTYLHRWQTPAWTSFDPKGVTGYRILSHTAGLSVHGYGGYLPGTTLPTLEESLSGATGYAVYVAQAPGMGFLYSGGGYTVMQLAIEEVTGQAFASYLRTNILLPLGMTSSAFEWLPELQARTAVAYSASGQRQPNYLFAEQAAAGLYSTAADYARFVAAGVVKSDQPLGRGVLAPSSVELSQTSAPASAGAKPNLTDGLFDPATTYGLGTFITRLSNGARLVYHSGVNTGWRCEWAALPDLGQGIVVLTNSDNGRPLESDVICDWIPRAGGGTASTCP